MLTDRKKLFADAVLRGLSFKDAAASIGLSQKTAKQAGSRMAKDADVAEYLKAARKAARARGRGHTLPSGEKAPDAPAGWPFGTTPPPAAQPEPEQLDSEQDDGLTDEQRSGLSPLDYMLAVMRSSKSSKSARMTAAIQAAPYLHARVAPQGKKEAAAAKSKATAGGGKFGQTRAPVLAASNGQRVK